MFQATILQQTGEYIEKLEREKKQLKQLLKTKDPTFNLDMEMDNDESEINQVIMPRQKNGQLKFNNALLDGNIGKFKFNRLRQSSQSRFTANTECS